MTGTAGAVRWIDSSNAADFATNVLLDPTRKRPVVAITTHRHSAEPTINPEELAGRLSGHADVVALRTGEATWALGEALPSRLDVFDGAARIWWPGLTTTSDPYDHPLLFVFTSRDADLVARRIVAAICAGDRRAGRWGFWKPPAPAQADTDPLPASPNGCVSTTETAAVVASAVTKAGRPVLSATVVDLQGPVIRVRVGEQVGTVAFADEKLDVLAARLAIGQNLPVFVASTRADGTPRYSTQGLLRAGAISPLVPAPSRPDATRAQQPNPVLEAIVTKIDGEQIHVSVEGEHGMVADADVPLARLAVDLSEGETLRVRRLAPDVAPAASGLLADPMRAIRGLLGVGRSPTSFSTRGLRPDSWRRIREAYHVGDVVRGRVCRIEDGFVLVEVLPSAALLAPISELDWSFVKHPTEVVRIGERVKVKILEMDPQRPRGTVSIKQAYMGDVLPAISPGPGQPLFLADGMEGEPHDEAERGELAERVEQLEQELASTIGDRAALMERLRAANDQVAEMKRDLRSAEDRLRAIESRASGDLDPTASANAFLEAVRVEYARRVPEGDRMKYPLRRMRVGREFLARLSALDGIAVEKVVEVCAQVASLRAHEVPAREVHELRAGEAGAPARTRADGAKAWRCSLQDNTASARRLHWWDVPGKDGRTIEFASVAVHDDFSIPG